MTDKLTTTTGKSIPILGDIEQVRTRLASGLIACNGADRDAITRLIGFVNAVVVQDDSPAAVAAVLSAVVPGNPADRARAAAQQVAVTVIAHSAKQQAKRDHRKAQAGVVFTYWQAIMHKAGARFDSKREHCIVARLNENDGDVSELCFAVDGATRDDFLMGKGGTRKYNGIETIFRDRGQVERLTEMAKGFRDGAVHPFVTRSADALMDSLKDQQGGQ